MIAKYWSAGLGGAGAGGALIAGVTVPEPASWGLMAAGILTLAVGRRWRRAART